ncbi:MAG: ribosomal subunit interface protein [Bacteroidota bacterium]|jgi:putative sigma-54 modulation protein
METKVHSIHFKVDQKLVNFIQERMDKLEHFNHKALNSEVFLRIDKDKEKENKIAEIKILLPGKELFAKKQSKSFEEAVDDATEALRKQILKEKEK